MNRRLFILPLMLCCALAGARTAPAQGGPGLLLPDMVPLSGPLDDYYVVNQNGRRRLRFDTFIANAGRGYLEVRGSRGGRRQPLLATQFIRTTSGGVSKRQFGQFEYHGAHNHWHLLQVAEYRLKNAAGATTGRTNKVSFCLIDSRRVYPNLSGSPSRRAYNSCPGGRNVLSLRSGISVGWADIYGAGLPDQWVDVTGVPPGRYTLEVEVNPSRVIQESNYNNNIARSEVVL